MTLLKICLLSLFFVFSSCSGQSKDPSNDWTTIGSDNQRSGYIESIIMKKEPKIKVQKKAVYYPVVTNAIAYFNNNEGKLSAFDIEKEVELWDIELDFVFNHLAIEGNVIYIAGYKKDAANFYIAAVNLLTQKKIWQIEEKMRLISGITVEVGKVYISGHTLSAYDSKTGKILWEFEPEKTTQNGSPYLSIPSISNELLYIGGLRTNFYALNADTGKEVWSNSKAVARHAIVASDKVIVTAENGHLYALDAITGDDVWGYEMKGTHGSATAPVAAKGVVYTASRGANGSSGFKIYALDIETGATRWNRDVEGWSISNLAIMENNLVFIVSDSSNNSNYHGILHALETENGNEGWKVKTNPTTALNPLVVTNNAILYTGEEGSLGDTTTKLFILK